MTPRELDRTRRKLGLTWNELMEAIGDGADEVWDALFGLAPMPDWLESVPEYARKYRREENHRKDGKRVYQKPVMIQETHEVYPSLKALTDDLGMCYKTTSALTSAGQKAKGWTILRLNLDREF